MHASNQTAVEASFERAQQNTARPARPANHRIRRRSFDIRLSMPWFGGRYYVRLLSGTERRHMGRLNAESQTGVVRLSLASGLILFAFFASALFGAAVFLYIVKSMLGINLFEAHSPFHRIFF